MKKTAKRVIIIDIRVLLSGRSFKKIRLRIADNVGAVAIITRVFATFVFWMETTKVIFVTLKVIT